MRTEAKRSFRHGFILSETELRRFRDTISGQMEQVCADGGYRIEYEVKFRNGALAEPAEMDEILDLENHGSSRITRLMMRAKGDNPDETYIEIKFTDASSDGDGSDKPLEYKVGGDNKDWVFVTSSKIEERISKVGTFRPARD